MRLVTIVGFSSYINQSCVANSQNWPGSNIKQQSAPAIHSEEIILNPCDSGQNYKWNLNWSKSWILLPWSFTILSYINYIFSEIKLTCIGNRLLCSGRAERVKYTLQRQTPWNIIFCPIGLNAERTLCSTSSFLVMFNMEPLVPIKNKKGATLSAAKP